MIIMGFEMKKAAFAGQLFQGKIKGY